MVDPSLFGPARCAKLPELHCDPSAPDANLRLRPNPELLSDLRRRLLEPRPHYRQPQLHERELDDLSTHLYLLVDTVKPGGISCRTVTKRNRERRAAPKQPA